MAIEISIRSQSNSKVSYSYSETVHSTWRGRRAERHFYGNGFVPPEIVKEGKKAIREYVRKVARNGIKEQKEETEKRDKEIQAVEQNISTTFKGIILQGKIHWSEKEDGFVISLESPLQNTCYWGYGEGFASSMSGRRKFSKDKNLEFIPEALKDAEKDLVSLYERSLPDFMDERETLE